MQIYQLIGLFRPVNIPSSGVNTEAVRDGVNGTGDDPGSDPASSADGGELTEKDVTGETETATESESRGSSKDAAQSMGLKKGA